MLLTVLAAAVIIYIVQALFVCALRFSHVLKIRKKLKQVGRWRESDRIALLQMMC